MLGRNNESDLQRELRTTGDLAEWVRAELYGVRQGGWRSEATTAVAASAAEETYRLIDSLPELQNESSLAWRANLTSVWAFLAGDRRQHHALSRAVADYLLSPLNHNEGSDGPNDFDRPQTVAAYSAALSAVAWGVDFAVTAVMQIFEAIDLRFDGRDDAEGRWTEVQHETAFVRRVVTTVVSVQHGASAEFSLKLLDSIRA